MTDRRAFIGTLAGGLLAAPFAAEAQQAAEVARTGYLAPNLAASPHNHEAFRSGLRDLGYVERRNVMIEYRDAGGKLERLPALAAELAALKVDVIFAPNTPAAVPAKQATKTIPIVFAVAGDPVGGGLATCAKARPGGDVRQEPLCHLRSSATRPSARSRRRSCALGEPWTNERG